jgi:cellulose synthase/poly-beta-1,6-N-acetylglucosamine synthase-like glycosyltransferase
MMNYIAEILYITIFALSSVNLARIVMLFLAADTYDVRSAKKRKLNNSKRTYAPWIDVIIPAFNEESGIVQSVHSVRLNSYPKKRVIVVNDGSSDRTLAKLRYYKRKMQASDLTIVNQKNGGKAHAINNALTNHAHSPLVMVLDADSILADEAIRNMVQHFRDRRVVAMASNCKVQASSFFLGLSQKYEYLLGYRMKRALTVLNTEYIIGGVGSTFRRKALEKCDNYDTDTMTEDIDVTMKLIRLRGNVPHRIGFAADSIAYTESVLSFKSLIKQRFRWKYGRMQTFLKNRSLFLSTSKRHSKVLSWYSLPYSLFGEAMLLLEPILVIYVIVQSVRIGDYWSLLFVYVLISLYAVYNIVIDNTEDKKSKLKLLAFSPLVYPMMYTITLVEYLALVKCLRGMKNLFKNTDVNGPVKPVSWTHVERAGIKL